MICPTCKAEGQTSRVDIGGGATTDMWSAPYYDEAGVYHHHDLNTTTWVYDCSRGHRWTAAQRKKCPAGDY